MIKLFVGGFPLDISEMDLAKLFAPHGDIHTIKIVRDRKTKQCKGYAFIEMLTEEGAQNAVDVLNDYPMGDRNLNVKISEEKPTKPAPPRPNKTWQPRTFSSRPSSGPSNPSDRPKRPRKQF